MKWVLFICTLFIWHQSSFATQEEYDDLKQNVSRSFQDYQDNNHPTDPKDQWDILGQLRLLDFINPSNLIPEIRCQPWACRIIFPYLMILPKVAIDIGINLNTFRIFCSVFVNEQMKYSQSVGPTDLNICIPFTSICFKITEFQLPLGPFCSELIGITLPCFAVNGLWPQIYFPKKNSEFGNGTFTTLSPEYTPSDGNGGFFGNQSASYDYYNGQFGGHALPAANQYVEPSGQKLNPAAQGNGGRVSRHAPANNPLPYYGNHNLKKS